MALLSLSWLGCDSSSSKPDSGVQDTGMGVVPTEHCGPVAGTETWSAAQNPHVLTCDVEVSGSLELEPGVEVFLDLGTTLSVNAGTLSALGEQATPILLESNSDFPLAGDHGGLVASDAQLELSWVTVRHGGQQGGLIDIDGGTTSLTHVSLANGSNQGLRCFQGEFTALNGLSVAYVSTPLLIPWNAASVLGDLELEEVGVEHVILYGDTLAREVVLPALDLPYYSGGVTVQAGGQLDVEGGATLQLAGDLQVEEGGALIIWGEMDQDARLESQDVESVTVSLEEGVETASFRYATLTGAVVDSHTANLLFKDSAILNAPSTALTVAGGVRDDNAENLQNNTFQGAGLGLLVRWADLDVVGDNDCSGSTFDGVAVYGGSQQDDLALDSTSFEVLVTEDVTLSGGTTVLESAGPFRFADDVSLVVDGGVLQAHATDFLHVDDQPGGWMGIQVAAGSDGTSLDACEIAHGGGGQGANIRLAAAATVGGNLVHGSAGWGIIVESGAAPTLDGNTYLDNALGDVLYE